MTAPQTHVSRRPRWRAALAGGLLRGVPGQKLTLEIENESETLHNFSIPEQHIDKDIPPKGKVKVEVTMPPSGAVHFLCKFHTALGMNGELLAGDAAPHSVSQGATHRTDSRARY